jgi:hypothetical protein
MLAYVKDANLTSRGYAAMFPGSPWKVRGG